MPLEFIFYSILSKNNQIIKSYPQLFLIHQHILTLQVAFLDASSPIQIKTIHII